MFRDFSVERHSNASRQSFLLIALFAFFFTYSLFMYVVETVGYLKADELSLPILYITGWAIIFCIIFVLAKTNGLMLLTSFYQVFYFLGLFVGATSAASGAYMYEIQAYGYPNGLFWFLIISFLTTFSGIIFGFNLLSWRIRQGAGVRLSAEDRLFSQCIVLVVLFCSFAVLALYGSPILIGVNRVQYWGDVAPAYLSVLKILLTVTFFLACGLAFRVDGSRRMAIYGRVSVALYLFLGIFLLGEKFSLFVIYVSIWLFFYAISTRRRLGARRKVSVRSIVMILVTVTAMFIQVAYRYEAAGLGKDFIFARLALQSQLVWSTMNEPVETFLLGLPMTGERINFANLRQVVGYRYIPVAVQIAQEASGTVSSGFMPTWQILVFGAPLYLLLAFLYGTLMGAIQIVILAALQAGRLVFAFMVFSLHFFLLSVWYIGNFNVAQIVGFLLLAFAMTYIAPRKKM